MDVSSAKDATAGKTRTCCDRVRRPSIGVISTVGSNPALTIDAGDHVGHWNALGNPEWMPQVRRARRIARGLRNVVSIDQIERGFRKSHLPPGPIFVRGTGSRRCPGGLSSVRHRTAPELDIISCRAYGGSYCDEFHIIVSSISSSDREFRDGDVFAIGPDSTDATELFGQIAVAPPKRFHQQNSKEPRRIRRKWIDCKELRPEAPFTCHA